MDPTEYVNRISQSTIAVSIEDSNHNILGTTPSSDHTLQALIDSLTNDHSSSSQTLIQNITNAITVNICTIPNSSYSVQSGDTFFTIADRLISEGRITSRQELIDANPGIGNINSIRVGQSIEIPISFDQESSNSVSYRTSNGNVSRATAYKFS